MGRTEMESRIMRLLEACQTGDMADPTPEQFPAGMSFAEVALVRARGMVAKDSGNAHDALDLLQAAIQCGCAAPHTLAMLYEEVGRLAMTLNEVTVLKRLRKPVRQLYGRHRTDPWFMRWWGRSLVQVSLYYMQTARIDRVVELLDEAIPLLESPDEQEWLICALLRRIYALGLLGRLGEAYADAENFKQVDSKQAHPQLHLLVNAWVTQLKGDLRAADRLAADCVCAAEAADDRWCLVLAYYMRLEVALALGTEDVPPMIASLQSLGAQQGFGHVFRVVKWLLLKYEYDGTFREFATS